MPLRSVFGIVIRALVGPSHSHSMAAGKIYASVRHIPWIVHAPSQDIDLCFVTERSQRPGSDLTESSSGCCVTLCAGAAKYQVLVFKAHNSFLLKLRQIRCPQSRWHDGYFRMPTSW